MTLQTLPFPFTVCKVQDAIGIDLSHPYTFAAITEDECSLVCQTCFTPGETIAREDGWRAFRVAGSMDFGLVGVLSGITGTLAAQGVPVFAVSTFDTDYVLVKADRFAQAMAALVAQGHSLEA